MRNKALHIGLPLILPLLLFVFVNKTWATEPLSLWIHPYLPTTELIEKFTPLADYLSQKCRQPVQVKISKSYNSHIARVGEERMDIAYLGPAPYVQVTKKYGPQKLLVCLEVNGKPFFHGLVITRQDSPLNNLTSLVNKKFAFGDQNSTMSFLVPRYMLSEKGIELQDLKCHAFLGSHYNVVLSVLGGYYDAGAIKEEVFMEYQERGIKILAKSPAIAEHLFVAGNNLADSTVDKLRRALLSLKDRTILSAIKKSATGLVPVTDADYTGLRRILNQRTISEANK